MEKITVTKTAEDEFEVVVGSEGATTHRVTLTDAYFSKLGGASKEDLIRRSFEFLLEREPKEAILRQFDLPLIGTYFPEYEETVG